MIRKTAAVKGGGQWSWRERCQKPREPGWPKLSGQGTHNPPPIYPGSSSSYEAFPTGNHELFTTFSWDDQKVRRLFIRKVTTSQVLWGGGRGEGFGALCWTPGRPLAQPLSAGRPFPLSCHPSPWLLLACASEISPRALAPCPLGSLVGCT